MTFRHLLTATALIATTSLGSASLGSVTIDDDDRRARTDRPDRGDRPDAAARGERDGRRSQSSINARIGIALGRIADGLESGKVTPEQAAKQLRGLQQRLSTSNAESGKDAASGGDRDRHRGLREEYVAAEAELKEAVASGRLSEGDAARRLESMRERMRAEATKRRGDSPQRGNARGQDNGDRAKRTMDLDGAKSRLAEAVKAGKLTQAQADERLQGFKARMNKRGEGKNKDR